MVVWLDKLTNLGSSIRTEVSSPESSQKDDAARFRRYGIEDAYAAKFLDNALLGRWNNRSSLTPQCVLIEFGDLSVNWKLGIDSENF